VSVEKESKVPVMLYAGQELVRLVQVSTWLVLSDSIHPVA
jgi:hypothetical protein